MKNDFKGFIGNAAQGHHHQSIDRYKDRFLSKPLISYELKVLSALNFQTTVPLRCILPHVMSIMTVLDTNLQDYLGEETYNEFIAIKRMNLVERNKKKNGDAAKQRRRNDIEHRCK